jgi:hypothetical protein
MRNLKKLLAVIMAVAMLASIMVPALAADYDDDARKLYDLGLFKGSSGSSYQPDLDGTLTREQGLTLMIRAMGKDEEALGMSEAEINEQLAKVEDAADITDWARPYVAYAVKNGLTKGIGGATPPNIRFGAQLDLSGKEFINFMLYAMGYPDAWDIVLDKAVEIGMLTAGEAVKFGSMDVIIRDVAIGIMAGSMGGTTAAGITLAQALVEAGVVTEEDMVEAGYMDPIVTPTPEPVELTATAYTDNLIQIYVVYSQEVDKDSAEDADNYDIDDADIDNIALQDDGVTAVITLTENKEQQDTVDLTIDGVKDLAGTEMDEYIIEDIEFLDTTIPTALSAAVVGNDTFKVVFSEPMEGDDDNELNRSDFVVKSSKTLYVKKVTLQNNNTEALIEMYAKLDEGDVELQVKSGSKDYAGFGVISKTFNLQVVPDDEKPSVIGYEKADQNGVTLIWNEDIEINDGAKANFYHTNYKNEVDADITAADVDGNKLKLKFTDNNLPEGTAYIYVLAESVNDLWDNENDQQMIQVEVEIDDIAPEVDKVDVGYDEDEELYYLEITYTEDVDGETAVDEDNYIILDADGDEIDNAIDWIEPDEDDVEDKVKIYFTDDGMSGDYAIVIENVKDLSGNKIAKVTVPFTVGDEIKPDDDKFTATLYNGADAGQMLKVFFDDVMATEGKYSVLDLDKYVLIAADDEETPLEDIDDVEIEITRDGKSVEITIPSTEDSDDGFDLDESYVLVIARVADAAGNKLAKLYTREIPIKDSAEVIIEKAKATAIDTIEVKFSDELVKFDVDDVIFTVAGSVYTTLEIASVDVGLDGGKTVATYTLNDDLDYEGTFGGVAVTAEIIDNDEKTDSQNEYGDSLDVGFTYIVEDAIAPEVIEDDDVLDIVFANGATDSTITIAFTETLDDEDEEWYAQDLIVKNDEGKTLKAGTDYTTAVDDNELVVTIKGVTDLNNYSIQSKASIEYIADEKGNTAKPFTKRVKN